MFYDPFHEADAIRTSGTPSRVFQRAFRTFNAGEHAMSTEKVTIRGKKKTRRYKRQFTHTRKRKRMSKSVKSGSVTPSSQDPPATEMREPADTVQPQAKQPTENVANDLPGLYDLQFDSEEQGNSDMLFEHERDELQENSACEDLDYAVDFHGPLLPWHEGLLLHDEEFL